MAKNILLRSEDKVDIFSNTYFWSETILIIPRSILEAGKVENVFSNISWVKIKEERAKIGHLDRGKKIEDKVAEEKGQEFREYTKRVHLRVADLKLVCKKETPLNNGVLVGILSRRDFRFGHQKLATCFILDYK
nr:uncharacterized protein LOC104646294 isoform X2 [Solanum lycopersicum]